LFEEIKVLCATVYNSKLGYDLTLWQRHIDKQTRMPDAIHIEPDPDDPNKYWDENVSYAREQCRLKAIRQGFDYLWFQDVDTLPPPHCLATLLVAGKDVACGRYYHKTDRLPDGRRIPMFWHYRYVPPEEREACKKRYGKDVVIEDWFYLGEETAKINKAGTGCMLISRKVFQRVGFPKKVPLNCTEDILYSIMVNAMEYEIWAVPSVTCEHIGPSDSALKIKRGGIPIRR